MRVSFGRVLCSAIVVSGLISPALSPALALDYEAKPVHAVISAPFKAAGAVAGMTACGLFSGPVDDGFHQAKKSTSKLAGALGDENGKPEIAVAAPVVGPVGLVVGGVKGVFKGAVHGAKVGWNKPFSRWSFLTMEEEGKK
jgi:hypothetical protein